MLREGPLEHLLCLKGTKEHEAILATDARPAQIHAGLLLTGAEPGHPVRFLPKFEPPAGTPIAIELRLEERRQDQPGRRPPVGQGREDQESPRRRTGSSPAASCSQDPITKRTIYAADDGDLITVANFGSAILDLPIASSASDADRVFSATRSRFPPRDRGFPDPCARATDPGRQKKP